LQRISIKNAMKKVFSLAIIAMCMIGCNQNEPSKDENKTAPNQFIGEYSLTGTEVYHYYVYQNDILVREFDTTIYFSGESFSIAEEQNRNRFIVTSPKYGTSNATITNDMLYIQESNTTREDDNVLLNCTHDHTKASFVDGVLTWTTFSSILGYYKDDNSSIMGSCTTENKAIKK